MEGRDCIALLKLGKELSLPSNRKPTKMNKVINTLFSIFPREIGIPWDDSKGGFFRREVTSKHDLINYIDTVNGISSCYCSVYDTNKDVTIDEVVFDLDSESLETALKDVIKLTKRIQDPYLVLFSGRRGFHLHVLLKPQKLRRDVAGFYIKELQKKLSKGIKTVDSHLIGDVSRMIRVPQTLNNKKYCTFLPPEFKNWNISQVLDWSMKPHELQIYGRSEYRTIEEVVGEIEVAEHRETVIPDDIKIIDIPPLEDLCLFIRPCVLEEMIHPVRKDRGAFHITRMSFVSELMFLGYTEEQCLNVFRLIHSKYPIPDFDEDKTMYQIEKIFENKVKPYGCVKLKEKGLPCTECGWKYWW